MQNRHRMGCGCHQVRQSRWIEPSILLMLLDASKHGYELMNILPELGFIDEPADPGIMYRTLRHLEEYDLVISEWDTSGAGPAKRRYTITEAGKEQLKLWSETLRQRQQAIGEFLKKVDQFLSK